MRSIQRLPFLFLAVVPPLLLALLLSMPMLVMAAAPQMEIIISVEYDGVAPFDGNDGADDNGIVRGGDAIGYRVDWAVNEGDVDELLITLPLPVSNAWSGLPDDCSTVGVATPSSISADGTTLTCNLGLRAQGSAGHFSAIGLAGYLADGTSIPLTGYITDDTGNLTKVASNEVVVDVSTGAASWSLAKTFRGTGTPRGTWSAPSNVQVPITDSNGILGRVVIFPILLLNTADPLVGSEPLDDSTPLVFHDFIGGIAGTSYFTSTRPATAADMAAAGLAGSTVCGPVDFPIQRVPFGSPSVTHPNLRSDNATPDSGSWTCDWGGELGSGGNGVMTVTVTGFNTASSARPQRDSTLGGPPITGGDDYAGVIADRTGRIAMAGQIAIFVPDSDTQARIAAASPDETVYDFNQLGYWTDDSPANGQVDAGEWGPWTHPALSGGTVTDSSTGGVPTNDVNTDTSSDDFMRMTSTVVTGGGTGNMWYRNFYQRVLWRGGPLFDFRAPTYSEGHSNYIPTQTNSFQDGDGTLVKGQHFTAYSYTFGDNVNGVICQVYDTRVIAVEDNQSFRTYDVPLDSNPFAVSVTDNPGQSGIVTNAYRFFLPPSGSFNAGYLTAGVDYVVEYSDTPIQPSEGSIGAGPNDWNVRAICDDELDAAPGSDWSANIGDFPAMANPSGFGNIYPTINRVRIRTLRPMIDERFEFFVSLQAKAQSTYGVGTYLATSSNDGNWPGDQAWPGTVTWSNGAYAVAAHNQASGNNNGDRAALGDAITRVYKGLSVGQPNDGLDVGDTIAYDITGLIFDEALIGATGLIYTDTVPAGTTYQSADPAPTSVSPDGKTVTWDFGAVSTPLRQTVKLTVTIDTAQPSSVFTNTVTMNVDGFVEQASEEASATMRTAGSRAANISKQVAPLSGPCTTYPGGSPPAGWGERCSYVSSDDAIEYTLIVANDSVSELSNIRLIDVLPYTGDATEPSGFPNDTGTVFNPGQSPSTVWPNPLAAGDGREPASDIDAAVTWIGIAGLMGGETVLYTKESPDAVHRDPNAPTNQAAGGTTWCDSIGGTPVIDSGDGCPATAAEVTAISVVIPSLSSSEQRTYTVELATNRELEEVDLWTNTFGARVDDLWLPMRSNDVSAMSTVERIGTYLWNDLSADGIRDADEPVLPDVIVGLYDVNNVLVMTTTTDANGVYTFTSMGPGDFRVEVDATEFYPGAKLFGFESSPLGNDSVGQPVTHDYWVTVGVNDVIPHVNFGLYGTGKSRIGDYVWYDTNGNGQHIGDPGEGEYGAGINNVLIKIYKDDGDGNFNPDDTGANGDILYARRVTTDTAPSPGPGHYEANVVALGARYWIVVDDSNFDPGGPLENLAFTNQNAFDANMLLKVTLDDQVQFPPDLTLDFGYVAGSYELAKTLEIEDPVRTGDLIPFQITITNTGPLTITALPLTDTYISFYMAYVDADPPADDNVNDGIIEWSDLLSGTSGLAPGDEISVTVEFIARADTSSLTGTDGRTINNVATENVVAAPLYPGEPPVNLSDLAASAGVRILSPTDVDMVSDSLAYADGIVEVRWETANERDMAGFYVERLDADGGWIRIIDEVVPANRSGQATGDRYSLSDSVQTGGQEYRYQLVITMLDGSVEMVDLGSVTSRERIYLPIMLH